MRPSFLMSGVATGMRRNLTMTVALILNTAIALSFAGGALLLSKEIGLFRQNYEDKLNVSVYLCNSPPYDATVSTSCTHRASATEVSALEQKFAADPDITKVTYLDQQASYDNGKKVLPKDLAESLTLGDLPAQFVLKLRNIKADYDAVAKTYPPRPGWIRSRTSPTV